MSKDVLLALFQYSTAAIIIIAVVVYGPVIAGFVWCVSLFFRRVSLRELLLLVAYFALVFSWLAFWIGN